MGCCCRHSGGVSQSSDCCHVSAMCDDNDMVKEVEGLRNLGRTEMLSCKRAGISVAVVVVLIVVMGVICLGACFLSVVEVDCRSVFIYGGRWHLWTGRDLLVVVVEVEVENFEKAGLVVFKWEGRFLVTFQSVVETNVFNIVACLGWWW